MAQIQHSSEDNKQEGIQTPRTTSSMTHHERKAEENTFPAYDHRTIPRKANKKSRISRKRANDDSDNKPQQKHRHRTVSNENVDFVIT